MRPAEVGLLLVCRAFSRKCWLTSGHFTYNELASRSRVSASRPALTTTSYIGEGDGLLSQYHESAPAPRPHQIFRQHRSINHCWQDDRSGLGIASGLS